MTSVDASPLTVTALLFGPLLLGMVQFLATEPGARAWHHTLNKSPYRPPGVVHGVAWIWSYVSLGYASLLVWRDVPASSLRSVIEALYVVHLVLQNSWGVCFFSLRRMDWALDVMVLLDVGMAMLLICVGWVHQFAAALCVPYFFWLLELTYLNMYMVRNNEQGVTKEQVILEHETPNNDTGMRLREVPRGDKED